MLALPTSPSLLKWSQSVLSNSLCPCGLFPWGFPGKSTGVGCRFLLRGIFPTQGSTLGLPHCRQTLYHLSDRIFPSLFPFSFSSFAIHRMFKVPFSSVLWHQVLYCTKFRLNICFFFSCSPLSPFCFQFSLALLEQWFFFRRTFPKLLSFWIHHGGKVPFIFENQVVTCPFLFPLPHHCSRRLAFPLLYRHLIVFWPLTLH